MYYVLAGASHKYNHLRSFRAKQVLALNVQYKYQGTSAGSGPIEITAQFASWKWQIRKRNRSKSSNIVFKTNAFYVFDTFD